MTQRAGASGMNDAIFQSSDNLRSAAPLRHALTGHSVTTAFEKGWSTLENGELLREKTWTETIPRDFQ